MTMCKLIVGSSTEQKGAGQGALYSRVCYGKTNTSKTRHGNEIWKVMLCEKVHYKELIKEQTQTLILPLILTHKKEKLDFKQKNNKRKSLDRRLGRKP